MYSIKNHFVKYLFSLFLSDIIIIVLKKLGILNFGLYFIIQLVVTVGFVYYGKIKLYKILEKERADIIEEYRFGGYFGTWEWNIIKAAKEQQDYRLKKLRNKVLLINVISLSVFLNFFIIIDILSKL